MFLIQLTSGREQVYRTREEFVAAIRSGEIAAGSLIFHRATARWISVTQHPEHRKFLAGLPAPAGSEAPSAHDPGAPPPGRVAGPLGRLAGIMAWLGRKASIALRRYTSFFP